VISKASAVVGVGDTQVGPVLYARKAKRHSRLWFKEQNSYAGIDPMKILSRELLNLFGLSGIIGQIFPIGPNSL